MECVAEKIDIQPTITREQESRLYKFLQERTEGDALRYELIAKKIHRAADATAVEGELAIVRDWLDAMNEEQSFRDAVQVSKEPQEQPFASVRRGQVGNPNYQAFLDTLEQSELDAITSNVPYFCWFSDRQSEMKKSGLTGLDYLRSWADQNLSKRVTAMRASAALNTSDHFNFYGLKQANPINVENAVKMLTKQNYRYAIKDAYITVQDPVRRKGVIKSYKEVTLFTNGDLRRFFSARP